MRFSRTMALQTLLITSLATACSKNTENAAPAPSAAPSNSSPSAEIPDAPPSPFSVVLESAKPLAFSGLGAGIAVGNEALTHLATQLAGADMTLNSMPEGLPSDGKIVRLDGQLPGSVWLSFETPAEGKNAPKNPLFRLDIKKQKWKRWTDDWKPLLAPWSGGRLLSMSTSSGKLKIKVVEPYRDKPDATWPSAHLGDEACEKSLRLDGLTTLPNGDVFAAGYCKAGGSSRKYVLVRWPVPSATPKTSASAAPAASTSAAPESSAMADNDPPSAELQDAGAADAGEAAAPDIGVHGEVLVVANAPAQIAHRELVAQGEKDVWALATERNGNGHLYRYDGSGIVAQALPNEITGGALSIAAADDGALWLVSTSEIWKRPAAGEWEKVPPPTGHWREPGPKWEMSGAWASKGDVWIAGKHLSAKGEHYVVIRLRAAKEAIKMP